MPKGVHRSLKRLIGKVEVHFSLIRGAKFVALATVAGASFCLGAHPASAQASLRDLTPAPVTETLNNTATAVLAPINTTKQTAQQITPPVTTVVQPVPQVETPLRELTPASSSVSVVGARTLPRRREPSPTATSVPVTNERAINAATAAGPVPAPAPAPIPTTHRESHNAWSARGIVNFLRANGVSKFPEDLAIVLVAFLLLQGRFDRNERKLRDAPMFGDRRSVKFP